MVCSRADRNIASMMPATIERTAAWSRAVAADELRESSVVALPDATVASFSGAVRVLMSAAGWASTWLPCCRFAIETLRRSGVRQSQKTLAPAARRLGQFQRPVDDIVFQLLIRHVE